MPDADSLPPLLNQETLKELLKGERTKTTAGGRGVAVRQFGNHVAITAEGRRSAVFKFDALLGSATSIGPNEWQYSFRQARVEIVPISGKPTWKVVSGGYDEEALGFALNRYEWKNTESGRQLNGITLPLPGTFEMQPIQPSVPVEMTVHLAPLTGEDTTRFSVWFGEPNQVDGVCEAPPARAPFPSAVR